jgi:hypothetical protein
MLINIIKRKKVKMTYCFYYNTHFVETVVNAGTSLQINTTNDTNISNLTPYYFKRAAEISVVPTAPIPVEVGVNGTFVALNNKYGQQIMSDKVPRRAVGMYVVPTEGDPYVILLTTPSCKCRR